MIGTLTLTLRPVPTMAEPSPADGAHTGPQREPHTDADSSLTLVRRAHAGDQAARDELCARYLPRLQRWAHGRLPASARGSLDTVDLVQDTFLRAYRALPGFKGQAKFSSWLYRIALNLCRDWMRRQRRTPAT